MWPSEQPQKISPEGAMSTDQIESAGTGSDCTHEIVPSPSAAPRLHTFATRSSPAVTTTPPRTLSV